MAKKPTKLTRSKAKSKAGAKGKEQANHPSIPLDAIPEVIEENEGEASTKPATVGEKRVRAPSVTGTGPSKRPKEDNGEIVFESS